MDVGRAQIAKAVLCRKNEAQRGCNMDLKVYYRAIVTTPEHYRQQTTHDQLNRTEGPKIKPFTSKVSKSWRKKKTPQETVLVEPDIHRRKKETRFPTTLCRNQFTLDQRPQHKIQDPEATLLHHTDRDKGFLERTPADLETVAGSVE